MSYLEKIHPDPLDRLGMILDHAQGMGMALTCEDFDEINDQMKGSYYSALLHVLFDAKEAFDAFLDERATQRAGGAA
ncbi:hypothetical protein J2X06_003391 [Lysobacter niastensis]|uniref:Uncharacterized protein n=1 Tax=Lysobacter niastensis TaxID=380629 RepID=A0ABU1WF13_9GAMM|nr:hypothetical protein [Lysobacter niastensis]MDR7136173.1 hypothetical protein [Lysobacter niastensis]